MAGGHVAYEKRGPLAIIRLERPEALNALTYPMIADVERYAFAAQDDPDVFAICITGAGRGFCAGIDMGVLAEHASGAAPDLPRAPDAAATPASASSAASKTSATSTSSASTPTLAPRARPKRPALFAFLLDVSKPVIAAVNGPAAGGGFVLAMMCDLRFVAHEAQLITVFSRRGLIAEHTTSWLLPRIVGLSRALDLLWSSRRVDAAEALRIGLADRTAPAAELLDAVEAYVRDMAATVAPRALAVIKAQVHRQLAMTYDDAADDCDRVMREALAHPDAAEGAASFVERRAPRFSRWPPAGA